MNIEEVMQDLNDLLENELDGTEAFYNLTLRANALGYRVKREKGRLVAVKAGA